MAVFSNHNFVVIADGNKLYYCQYGTEPKTTHELLGERKLIKTFDHDIVSLDANELQVNTYKQKYDYPGQLGVALDNGEFFIFSIIERLRVGDSQAGIPQRVCAEQQVWQYHRRAL